MKTNVKTDNKKGIVIAPINDRTFSLNEITASPALDYVGIGFDENYNCYLPPVNRHALAKLVAYYIAVQIW